MRSRRRNSGHKAKKISRRSFVGGAAAGAVFATVPRHVLGGAGYTAPSERLNIACIGVGAQGTRVMLGYLARDNVQIVAVCDVDKGSTGYTEWGVGEMRRSVSKLIGSTYVEKGYYTDGFWAGRDPAQYVVESYYAARNGTGSYKGCPAYNDFREMLEKQQDIDAVLVATPDHLHAVASITAMKMGKHVHCQKPMTHSVYEARKMAEGARRYKVATQVATGNQASEETRLLCEWIWDGAIGPVREVHNWSNRPIWPQGLERPEDTPPVPPNLDWDLWLGPSPYRPYHPAYLPFVWRGWHDFGTGALGDMGCYSFDTILRVLKLGHPTSVEAISTKRHEESFPLASIVRYEFPARGDMPPVKLTWYDGMLTAPRPHEMDDGVRLRKEGLLFVGDDGKILCQFTGGDPHLIPESKDNAYRRPPKTLPRSIGHDEEWIEACKGGQPAGANFEIAGPITEALLLGNVALRAGGDKIRWDGPNMKVTNVASANNYVAGEYRDGWSL